MARRIHVTSTKYDGSRHWEFDCEVVREEGSLLVASNHAGQTLTNPKGEWRTPWDTLNHFWTDRWYNVMRCHTSNGRLDNFYCNVATPAVINGDQVTYVDLDLDLRVSAEGRLEILDEDEFLEHSRRMSYPRDVIEQSRAALDELVRLASAAEGPFEILRDQEYGSS